MTIRNHINIRELNERLRRLESCADTAPDGTYENAKQVAAFIGDIADQIIRRTREHGLAAPNCDQIREVEVVIYRYLRDANPTAFAAAEGFGEHINGPNGPRMIADAIRNRNFLQQHTPPAHSTPPKTAHETQRHEYLFDAKLFSALRISAPNRARRTPCPHKASRLRHHQLRSPAGRFAAHRRSLARRRPRPGRN